MKEEQTIRAFIALEIPETIREQLRPSLNTLRDQYPGMKWVDPNNLHLTLKFLGEITPSQCQGVQLVLEDVASQELPFVMEFASVGYFGSRLQPQVIWLGLRDSGGLNQLACHVEAGCQQMGLDPENKSFRPHITLARARSRDAGTVSQLPDLTLQAELPSWQVGAIALMRSELTPRGPTYTRLREWRLGG